MNIKSRYGMVGLTAAALLLAGAGLVGVSSGAAAEPDRAPVAAAAQPGTAVAAAADAASTVGTWTMTTDFGCDGSITGSFTVTFASDGTWTSTPFVHNGRWYQVGGIVVWTFADVANLVYSGNLSGNWFSGVQGYETAGGINGCFGGEKASGAAGRAARVPAGVDPATNR